MSADRCVFHQFDSPATKGGPHAKTFNDFDCGGARAGRYDIASRRAKSAFHGGLHESDAQECIADQKGGL
jgi:hypothetical protein